MGEGNTAEIETGTVTVAQLCWNQTRVNRSSDTKVVIGYGLQPNLSRRGYIRYIRTGKYPQAFKNDTSVRRGCL